LPEKGDVGTGYLLGGREKKKKPVQPFKCTGDREGITYMGKKEKGQDQQEDDRKNCPPTYLDWEGKGGPFSIWQKKKRKRESLFREKKEKTSEYHKRKKRREAH